MSVFPNRVYYSNLNPQSYNADALGYLSANKSSINDIANRLSVSPEAVAGSIGREITRADGEDPYSAIGHRFAVWRDLNHTSEAELVEHYTKDLAKLKKSPEAFDGKNIDFLKRVLNPTISDIGPGSIKILTAFQIIKQYQDTPQGITLGLDKYKLTDLKAIVNDLNDRNSTLSIKITGLVILNGQKFFSDKTIDGIPWAKLTKEQQDAALTAYYTVGEHAVSVDMAKNEFFPFTPSPKGGKVGPWILFGSNYANLNTILAKGRSLGVTVAPVLRRKAPQRALSPRKQHEAAGMLLSPVQKVLDALPPGANYTRTTVNAALAPVAKYMAAAGGWPRALALQFGPGFIAEVNRQGSKYTVLAKGQSSGLVHAFGVTQRAKAGITPWAMGKTNSVLAPSWLSHGNLQALPSIAPISRRERVEAALEHIASRNLEADMPATCQHAAPAFEANRKIDPRQLRGALDELLDRAARRPPTGTTAFDPRLTPAWAGLKLPA